MIVAIDIGNTNIVVGVFRGDDVVAVFRVSSDDSKTCDEYAVLLVDLFEKHNIRIESLRGAVIACVVPRLYDTISKVVKNYLKLDPLVLGPTVKTGLAILCDNPGEVGADRIANGVAVYRRYKSGCVVVDFGTATTFDCVSSKGEYLGGVITPGITISSDALFSRTSKLPKVELMKPPCVIGKNTIESIQSGIVNGYASMVDGLIEKIKDEMGGEVRVLATGGLAPLIARESSVIEEVDEYLTLKGLKYIFELNV